MKYRRPHRHNGVAHKAGDPFRGTVNTGRFLYQRGILEPDGHADDPAITRNPGRRFQAWDQGEQLAQQPKVTPVHTGGGMYAVGSERVRGKAAAIARADQLNSADTGDAWATPGPKEI